MRPQLARFTEWSWLQGRVTDSASLEILAAEFQTWLVARHPGLAGSRREGLAQIEQDMRQSLRALTYGGRARTSVPAPRADWLRTEALRLGWN